MEPQRGRRYLRRELYQVTYFAGNRKIQEQEINAVTDRLYPVLEYIKMDGSLIRGTQMEHETEDNELHFSVHYDIFMLRPRPEVALMQELIQKQALKE